ncbi:hypothetical protein V866_002862 [Kwoniella sp. B9012]
MSSDILPLQDTALTNLFTSSSPCPQQNTGRSLRTTCSQGTDAGCTDTTQHSARLTKTSFDNLGCRDSVTHANNGNSAFTVFDVGESLQTCAEASIATLTGTGGSNTYTCHCSQGRLALVGDSVTCGADLLSPGRAQASGLSRRRARRSKELQARRRRREVEYCSYGLTLVTLEAIPKNTNVLTYGPNWSSLEFCGGCMHGQSMAIVLDKEKSNTDCCTSSCTTLGVALGASTCVNGKCVASACKKGLRLVDGPSQ